MATYSFSPVVRGFPSGADTAFHRLRFISSSGVESSASEGLVFLSGGQMTFTQSQSGLGPDDLVWLEVQPAVGGFTRMSMHLIGPWTVSEVADP